MIRNVTMQDIADRLGVSKVTVSKALTNKDGVGEELREKIKKLAMEMGYRYNSNAKSVKAGISYNIGVISPEKFSGPISFYMSFYQSISKVLEQKNYSAILHILTSKDEKELQLPRAYNECKVDGFIVLGQIENNYIEILRDIDIPIVFLDFYDQHEDIDSVITDNFYGAYTITNYLVKNGHRDIAYVGNIYATSSIQDRYLGYIKSLLEHRIPVRDDYIINDRNDSGVLIDAVLPEKMPTAFVCNCDQVAYKLIGRLKAEGYKIPDDCSVVGFDNDIYATLCEPNLTTIQVNVKEMTRLAVEIIIKKIKKNQKVYGRVPVRGEIIFRESVKPL